MAKDFGCDTFQALRKPPPGQRPMTRELVEALITFVRTSDDLWLVDRVAAALASCEDEIWTPLFLDLLDHPSSQIRWRAVQQFADVPYEDARPVLEGLWKSEEENWIRSDLMRALVGNGSTAPLNECMSFVDSADAGLSSASIDCLRLARPAGALESVLRLARESDFCLRRRALAALAAWPESSEALALLLEESSTPHMPGVAVKALVSFQQTEATERLLEIAGSTDFDASMRLSAISAIADREHPAVVPILRGILTESDSDESSVLKYSARQLLISLGIRVPPAAMPTTFTTTIKLECVEPNYGAWTVKPEQRQESVRCWASPGIQNHGGTPEHVPGNLIFDADDHFMLEDEHWVHLGFMDCWLPVGLLEIGSGRNESGVPTEKGVESTDLPP